MASEILAGMLAQGAGSLVGAGASLWAQQREQDWSAEQAAINRQFQSEEADKARDWNEQMWYRQNEYNNPVAQYQRLKELGINDASIMSMMSGNGAAGNATSVASQLAPSGSQASGQGSIAAGLGQYIADIPKAGVELAINSEEWYNKKIQNEIAEETKQDLIHLAHLNVTEANKRIENLIEQTRSIEQQRKYVRLQAEFQDLTNQQFKRTMDLEYKLLQADYKLKNAQITNMDAATALANAQRGKIPWEVGLLIAQRAYQEEATKHVGDVNFEQWLVGVLGPMIENAFGLEHGSGETKPKESGITFDKNGEIVVVGDDFATKTINFFNDMISGKNASDKYVKKMKKDYNKLSSDYLSGKISSEQYRSQMDNLLKQWSEEKKRREGRGDSTPLLGIEQKIND